jgi:hypothetical protein
MDGVSYRGATSHLKTGKVNECQGNGITLDNIKMQIKSRLALLAPPGHYRVEGLNATWFFIRN